MIEARESGLLDLVAARYRADGFDFFIDPSPSLLPASLRAHRPDAIAVRPDKKIVIELARQNNSADKINRLREEVERNQGWELSVLYAPASPPDIAIPSRHALQTAARQVAALREAGQPIAALLVGWSALEAISRALMPEQLRRAQPAGKLIEALAFEGYLTPDEADALRPTAALRNAAAHGRLDAMVEAAQLDALLAAFDTLAGFLPQEAA